VADLDVVAVTMVPAIDQHLADAGCAHFIECDFDRVGSWSPTHESQLHPKMHPNRVFIDFQSEESARRKFKKCQYRRDLLLVPVERIELPTFGLQNRGYVLRAVWAVSKIR
jgi:hypothetical protein